MLCFFQANKNSIKTEQRNQFVWDSKWIDLVELIWWKPWKRRWTLRTITLSMLHNTITTLLIERCDLKNEIRWQQHRKNTLPIHFGNARALAYGENGTRPKGLRSLLIYKIKFTVTQLFAILCICLFSFSGSIFEKWSERKCFHLIHIEMPRADI